MAEDRFNCCPCCGSTSIRTIERVLTCTICATVIDECPVVPDFPRAVATLTTTSQKESCNQLSNEISTFVVSNCSKEFKLKSAALPEEVALEHGHRAIQKLASKMKLSQECIDSAIKLFLVAYNEGFTQSHGRKSADIVSACLYMACFQEKIPQLLIDFVEARQEPNYSMFQADFFVLGSCLLELSLLLGISLVSSPDPCLYMHRFVRKLGFGNEAQNVSMTALRIVARMRRDWIKSSRDEERFPLGICGAALLAAASLRKQPSSQQAVLEALRVSEETLRSVLYNFQPKPYELFGPRVVRSRSRSLSSSASSAAEMEELEAEDKKETEQQRMVRLLVFGKKEEDVAASELAADTPEAVEARAQQELNESMAAVEAVMQEWGEEAEAAAEKLALEEAKCQAELEVISQKDREKAAEKLAHHLQAAVRGKGLHRGVGKAGAVVMPSRRLSATAGASAVGSKKVGAWDLPVRSRSASLSSQGAGAKQQQQHGEKRVVGGAGALPLASKRRREVTKK